MVNDLGSGTTRLFIAFLLAGGVVAGSVQSGQTLGALTVPAAALPSGCALKPPAPRPAPISRGGVTVIHGATWSPFPTNPWSGSDRKFVTAVRKAIDGAPRMPDGPPLEARDAAAFELKWVEHILEAYHAGYASADGSQVEVFAVTFNDVKFATPAPSGMLNRPRGERSLASIPTDVWIARDAARRISAPRGRQVVRRGTAQCRREANAARPVHARREVLMCRSSSRAAFLSAQLHMGGRRQLQVRRPVRARSRSDAARHSWALLPVLGPGATASIQTICLD